MEVRFSQIYIVTYKGIQCYNGNTANNVAMAMLKL